MMNADPLRELIIGESPAIVELRAAIRQLAASKVSTLIQGPTGSGKELVARALHELSGRRGPFVVANVPAIAESMFEDAFFGHVKGAFTGATSTVPGYLGEAHRGTLFLDEIGSLSLTAQPKLLRAIETGVYRPVGARADQRSDFRVVAATNVPLGMLVEQERFRADLMFRLREALLTVPALSGRLDDIPALVFHFLANGYASGSRLSVAPDALMLLHDYAWDGNVRELRSVVEVTRTLRAEGTIGRSEMRRALEQVEVQPRARADRELWADRQDLIDRLERARWNTARLAEQLGVHRATVYRRMARLGISPRG